MSTTLYWHDYETSGTDPRRDRPMQFAGLRTDEDLNVVGEPLSLYCRLADDVLPQPDACLVTGLTPARVNREGVAEAEFIGRIVAELGRPGTCGVGYNSLRFDDEVTRNCLYRNFHDPYAREWRYGNSRWDLINVMRMTRALRPEDIQWPDQDDGTPSFRLEQLTAANGIGHANAHDALADVTATIELARLLKRVKPRLYDFAFRHRRKEAAWDLLQAGGEAGLLHSSSMYPSRYCGTAVVLPLGYHPANGKAVAVWDLRHDPADFIRLDAATLRERLFRPAGESPGDVPRPALKLVHINKSPVLAPVSLLEEAVAERLELNLGRVELHRRQLLGADAVKAKIAAIFTEPERPPETNPDLALYSGGFFGDADRDRFERIRQATPVELAALDPGFDDPRCAEMLFRYRARNWPDSLDADERRQWAAFCFRRLTDPQAGGSIALETWRERVEERRREAHLEPAGQALLDELNGWIHDHLQRIRAEAAV